MDTIEPMIQDYVEGQWRSSSASSHIPVLNPATAEELGCVPLRSADGVDLAAQAASRVWIVCSIGFNSRCCPNGPSNSSRIVTAERGKTFGRIPCEMRRPMAQGVVARVLRPCSEATL